MVKENTINVVQQLLDGAVYVETYHLLFGSIFSHPDNLDLQKMQGLRMLEISVRLNWDEVEEVDGHAQHNPLNDAMRTLETAPHSVKHLILNLNICNPDDLSHFMGFASLDHLGDRPALQDVVVWTVSGYNYSALQHGIRYLEDKLFCKLGVGGCLTSGRWSCSGGVRTGWVFAKADGHLALGNHAIAGGLSARACKRARPAVDKPLNVDAELHNLAKAPGCMVRNS
ncbi:hypothetical protein MVEN_00018600 [Mycena venus]|uniref:Uncharacterized protein n=1 Tax=Mycena venus TaxID=2733690 RepID=A0A8H6Z8A8_9AGAR|nr:hypothetical protein MVEN_00018600 [Mycena venus]